MRRERSEGESVVDMAVKGEAGEAVAASRRDFFLTTADSPSLSPLWCLSSLCNHNSRAKLLTHLSKL
jgi:hypothetical protein